MRILILKLGFYRCFSLFMPAVWRPFVCAKKKRKAPSRKIVLRLPDLDHAKSAVLNSLSSPCSRRNYKFAMEQFITWYCSEPRLALNRTVVLRFRLHLESLGLAAGTINQRLAAVRRLAYEAADSGLLSPELAAGIRRVKGVKQLGSRAGNWLTRDQARTLLETADGDGLRCLRDFAMISVLLGCGLRRAELSALEVDDLQIMDSCANPSGSPLLRFLASFEESLQVATSPCCYTGSSRRYLCESFLGCLIPYPGGSTECFYLFLLLWHRPSPKKAPGRLPQFLANTIFHEAGFRGCRYFFMFRPPSLLVSQIVPTAAVPPQGGRDFYFRAERASLPPHAPDMLAVRIQAIDGTGTFTLLDSQPCRLLSLPSCYSSYGAWTLTPVGLAPTDHASLRWTHTGRYRSARCFDRAIAHGREPVRVYEVGVAPGPSPGVYAFYRGTTPLADPEPHPIS